MADFGIKAAVIACNTATATCIDALRGAFPFPIVSIEPAIKPACETEGSGRVLMLSTAATASLPRYKHLLSTMKDPSRVVSVPCPGLVERIERGCFAADAFDDILEKHLSFLEGETIDAIVMGCTHYVFIKKPLPAMHRCILRERLNCLTATPQPCASLAACLKPTILKIRAAARMLNTAQAAIKPAWSLFSVRLSRDNAVPGTGHVIPWPEA